MKNVIAVVVTFNRKELLKEALMSLLNQTYKELKILVVDNASTDGTKEYIEDLVREKDVEYINTGANIGGAGGFYTGVKRGAEEGYEYIWVMDDDTIPNSKALEELVNAGKKLDDRFGFLCSDVRWTDGSSCAMNKPDISISRWYDEVDKIEEGLIAVDQCSFVSCFFRSELVYKVGLPIKEFFIWGDDAEYTRRLNQHLKSYLVLKSKVVHKMISNTGANIVTDSPDRLFRYQFSYRNGYYVAKQQKNKISKVMYHYGIFLDLKNILKSKKKGKIKKIKIMLKSSFSGRWFKPQIQFPEKN